MKIVLKSCSNLDRPCLIEYIRALFVYNCATFESKSYQLIPRHGWSSILVPVNPCITEYTVLEPCAQTCSVSDRLKGCFYLSKQCSTDEMPPLWSYRRFIWVVTVCQSESTCLSVSRMKRVYTIFDKCLFLIFADSAIDNS